MIRSSLSVSKAPFSRRVPEPMQGSILFLQPIPKPLCGVSDHTQRLIDAMAVLGVKGRRVSLDEIRRMRNSDLAQAQLFVQTSIYGFQRKGVPLALAVQVARAKRCGAHVSGFFHETWVPEAPFLTSAYWLRPAQRLVCEWLATRFRRAHFNNPWSLAWGRAFIGERARFSPTFSTVGEPETRKPLGDRPARLVVFGSPGTRRAAYDVLSAHLPALVKAGHVSELVDIGAGDAAAQDWAVKLPDLHVRVLGSSPAAAISAELAEARCGVHFTPWALATKSSIYGALLAHGVLPVSIYDSDAMAPPHTEGSGPSQALLMGVADWHRRLQAGAKASDFQPLVDSALRAYKSVDELAREIVADFAVPGTP